MRTSSGEAFRVGGSRALAALVLLACLPCTAAFSPLTVRPRRDATDDTRHVRPRTAVAVSPLGDTAVIDVVAPSESVSVQAGEVFDDVMLISNLGTATLIFTVTCETCEDDSGGTPHVWLTLEPSAAEVAAGDTVSVLLHYDTTGLAAGTYTGEIDIQSNDPVSPILFFPVALNVADSCETFLHLSYPGAPSFVSLGETLRAVLEIGAGRVGGGTSARINQIRFNLDCDDSQLSLNCPDDGEVVSYQGQLASTCGVEWLASTAPGDALPNQVVLTPSTPLNVPADNPHFCDVGFDLRVETPSNDASPNVISEVAGMEAFLRDAECDNTPPLASDTITVITQICIAPPCDDGNQCNGTETFDQELGECVPGTPLSCDDADPCTIDSCDPNVLPPDDPCRHDPDPTCSPLASAPPSAGPSDAGAGADAAELLACTGPSSCESIVRLAYQEAHAFNAVGDTIRPVLQLGAGNISGTLLAINRLRFVLDCNGSFPGLNCPDDGIVVSYQGNLATNCGVTFTTDHVAGDALPNQVVFTPTPPLLIPAGTPHACDLAFDVRMEGPSQDTTPLHIEQVAGTEGALGDAVCDTSPPRAGAATNQGRLRLCICDDLDPCNGVETCDGTLGCVPGEPLCDDHNACTSDACDPVTLLCTHVPACDGVFPRFLESHR